MAGQHGWAAHRGQVAHTTGMRGMGQGTRGRGQNVGGGWNIGGGRKWWQRQHVQGCSDLSLHLGTHGSQGEGMGEVQDVWITAVVGWLHGQPVGENGQSG